MQYVEIFLCAATAWFVSCIFNALPTRDSAANAAVSGAVCAMLAFLLSLVEFHTDLTLILFLPLAMILPIQEKWGWEDRLMALLPALSAYALLALLCKMANALLSEPYFLTGSVVSGRSVGKKIGFPTANLQTDCDKLLPLGVYGGEVQVNDITYKCIVNVGDKPTFDEDSATVEAHLIDFDADLYGQVLKVSLKKFLRKISKFSNPDELVRQLQEDRENAKYD